MSREETGKMMCPEKRLKADMQKMFENMHLADFELRCNDGVTLKCHKCILAAHSPVFEAMLINDTDEARQGYAKILDCDSKLMKEYLRFVYYESVENIHDIAIDLL